MLLTIFSCEDTTIIKNYTGTGEEKTYSIEGYAQKGPFIVGTDVTVSELNDELFPTGRVFFATVLDEKGYFELPGIILESPFIQIKIQGLSYSETQGGVPLPGELTLYSIADIRETQTINVNILTHLEKERVEYLVQNESKSFNEAKQQALEELLSVFSLEDHSINAFEELSILSESEGNAILLAISSIIEGIYEYERKLELITNFQNDFQDGELNSVEIQNTLVSSAVCLDISRITEHLIARFPDIVVPNFEPVLNQFIGNTEYTNYFKDIFTQETNESINILEGSTTSLDPSNQYVLYFNPPKGIEVFLYMDLYAQHSADIASFDASSLLWTEVNHQGDCSGETCTTWHRYTLILNGNNLDPIEIPISFIGSGTVGMEFQFNIDGFGGSKTYFTKNITW